MGEHMPHAAYARVVLGGHADSLGEQVAQLPLADGEATRQVLHLGGDMVRVRRQRFDGSPQQLTPRAVRGGGQPVWQHLCQVAHHILGLQPPQLVRKLPGRGVRKVPQAYDPPDEIDRRNAEQRPRRTRPEPNLHTGHGPLARVIQGTGAWPDDDRVSTPVLLDPDHQIRRRVRDVGERLTRLTVDRPEADVGDPGSQRVRGGKSALGKEVGHPSTVIAPDRRTAARTVPEFPRDPDHRPGTVVLMILVTGATGTIGSEVVRQLAERGEKVRALTRDLSKMKAPNGVEVARGDYLDPASVDAALSAATAVFLVGVLGPDDADRDRALVAQAKAAGVHRIVKLSAIGTGDPAIGRVGSWHLPGEQAVKESELEWTVLRPSSFASNTLSWAEPIRAGRPVPNMTGDGLQGVIDPRDVSEAAVEALLSARHAGHTYTLTGPEAISVPDQAAILGEVLGRPVDTVDLTPDESRAQLTEWGMDAAYVEGVMAGSAYVRMGGNAVVTEGVRQVLGRQPRTYQEWAEDHRTAFGEV
jgi:uncharacterized protein YbjT (DUF2867 family)